MITSDQVAVGVTIVFGSIMAAGFAVLAIYTIRHGKWW